MAFRRHWELTYTIYQAQDSIGSQHLSAPSLNATDKLVERLADIKSEVFEAWSIWAKHSPEIIKNQFVCAWFKLKNQHTVTLSAMHPKFAFQEITIEYWRRDATICTGQSGSRSESRVTFIETTCWPRVEDKHSLLNAILMVTRRVTWVRKRPIWLVEASRLRSSRAISRTFLMWPSIGIFCLKQLPTSTSVSNRESTIITKNNSSERNHNLSLRKEGRGTWLIRTGQV